MSIFADKNTRLLVQGITGSEGMFHTRKCIEYGTKVVAGVTPGKGGQKMDDVPVFNTVREARKASGANASMIFVPPRFAADSIMEAIDAGIELVVCITEGIPILDMMKVKNYLLTRPQTLPIFAGARGQQARAVGADQVSLRTGQQVVFDFHHVQYRNAFRDADH